MQKIYVCKNAKVGKNGKPGKPGPLPKYEGWVEPIPFTCFGDTSVNMFVVPANSVLGAVKNAVHGDRIVCVNMAADQITVATDVPEDAAVIGEPLPLQDPSMFSVIDIGHPDTLSSMYAKGDGEKFSEHSTRVQPAFARKIVEALRVLYDTLQRNEGDHVWLVVNCYGGKQRSASFAVAVLAAIANQPMEDAITGVLNGSETAFSLPNDPRADNDILPGKKPLYMEAIREAVACFTRSV
jgi:hypothetical protein